MEPDDETGFVEHPSRARRAKAVGAAALLVLAIAAIAYVRPSLAPSAATSSVSTAPHPPTGYQLDAVAFVDPSTGWVLADLDNSTFTVLATTNAGRTWKTVLLSSSPRPAEYMRFFDRRGGVVVALGPSPTVYATGDGGVHWSPHTLTGIGYAIAASFVDPKHGWLLRYGPQGLDAGATELLGTADGGTTWKNLGDPAGNQAQAFAVSFSDSTHGWLDTVASRPQAFTTSDGGATWRPVALPTPAGGWPAPHGSYFVAARPTLGGGVVVTVINSQHINGRNAAGNVVLNYPPLTVRTYDGGSPVEYIYSTFVDSATDGAMRVFNTSHRPGPAISQTPPAGQVGFRSTDGGATWSSFMPPAPGGTIGYTDATAWWWVGPGESAQTSDGGQTWSPQRPDPVTNPLPGSLIVLDSSHAWLSALDDQGPVLFTTSDGGGLWNEVRLPAIAG
jgi:photosystem II stability/assembly factor-like uncharacterized protein